MKKPHYAWAVCFACALMLFCVGGLCINAFGIYLPYIRTQNGFTNTQASAIDTAYTIKESEPLQRCSQQKITYITIQ